MKQEKTSCLNNSTHPELLLIQEKIYTPCNFDCSVITPEAESAEYLAHSFRLNNLAIQFRFAKITPTKVGQFVTIWKRIGAGPIQAYDLSDDLDFFVINVRAGENFGQFVFPKSVLCKKDIVSKNKQGGKRGIRVYPPWDITTSRQAQKTQQWQLNYFLLIPQDNSLDRERAKMLYSNKIE